MLLLMIHDVSSMEYGKVEEIKASAEETERLKPKSLHNDGSEIAGKKDDYFLKACS